MTIHYRMGDAMFERVKGEMKTVSGKLNEAQDMFIEHADTFVSQARHKAHLAKNAGAQRLWHFENDALDWVEDVIGRSDMPAVERVREPVSRLVGQARATVMASPIEDYQALNARSAASAVRELDLVGLLKIERIEAQGKGRKTVYEAIDRRRKDLSRAPFRTVAEA
jgi:hypothetical protein